MLSCIFLLEKLAATLPDAYLAQVFKLARACVEDDEEKTFVRCAALPLFSCLVKQTNSYTPAMVSLLEKTIAHQEAELCRATLEVLSTMVAYGQYNYLQNTPIFVSIEKCTKYKDKKVQLQAYALLKKCNLAAQHQTD